MTQRRGFIIFATAALLFFSMGLSGKVPPYLRVHETDEPLLPRVPPVKRPDVYELKVRLKELGLYTGALDEVYDAATIAAVKRFQKSYWLEPNGVVDQATWKALGYGVDRPSRPASGPMPEGVVHLEVDTEKAELTVYVDGKPWKTYPVAVGRWASLTPVGEWKIVEKGYESGGAFGTRWMALDVPWGGYGIHGTNRPWSIGTYASLGCVRLFNEDVEELFEIVSIGTRVKIKGYRPPLDFGKPFGPGTIGPEVVRLQEALREFGFDAGPCDGRYGPRTAESVREVRSLFGLGLGDSATRDVFVLLGVRGK
ncbi:MAG: peptidoglycan-binding protein [Candidatus Fermentithermobacillus carboniphilus]|uniref:Peptidoglycan-binding protein n=1 Tax=Candidatus Fermentithermobacillus carboniphilus TaxID=3085328 RepID=A0AAT9LCJ9_9FIRM|nr:MAG: peptidoglycan-binding protein [Candidatus Fermentithermobacillus carboniphilus]